MYMKQAYYNETGLFHKTVDTENCFQATGKQYDRSPTPSLGQIASQKQGRWEPGPLPAALGATPLPHCLSQADPSVA